MPQPTTTIKISRRGFRKAPANVKVEAERRAKAFAEAAEASSLLAELRPSVYCGPGSAGDRGAYTLSLTASTGAFTLESIEVSR